MFDNKVSMHNNMKLFGSMDSRFQDFVFLLRLVEHQLHQLLPTVNHLCLLGAGHLKDLILVVDILLKNKHWLAISIQDLRFAGLSRRGLCAQLWDR